MRFIKTIISQMTLEEKVGMCSGADFWRLKSVEHLGIPTVMVSDGPHGLIKQSEQTFQISTIVLKRFVFQQEQPLLVHLIEIY